MSGRFDWLEVERQKDGEARAAEEPYDARLYLARAELAFRRGAREAALKLYGQCLGEDAMRPEAWLGQVLCLGELGEGEEARVWSAKALERFPGDAELLAARAWVLAGLGDPAAAEHADAAIAKRSPAPWVWLLRGLVLLRLESGRGPEERCFRKALEGGDPAGALGLRAALGYLEAGEPVSARPFLEAAVERDAENPLAWHALGAAFEGIHALGRATRCYERALELKPEFKDRVVDDLHRLRARPWWLAAWGRARAWLGGMGWS